MTQYHSDFTQQYYEKGDFLKLIEGRVRKELRINQQLDTKGRYQIKDDGKLTTQILIHLLKRIFDDRLKISLVDTITTIEIHTTYLEEYIASHLEAFLGSFDKKQFTKQLAPLRVVTLEECKQLAQIFDLKGDISETKHDIVDKLAAKYKQTKTSLLKSFMHLEEQFE